jgi:hypothetical protein
VPVEAGPGNEIPILGFGQLTLFSTAIGGLIAHTLRRRAARPRSAFVRLTVVLTALSLVPDAVLSTDAATKVTLALSHIVAAVIPRWRAVCPGRREEAAMPNVIADITMSLDGFVTGGRRR